MTSHQEDEIYRNEIMAMASFSEWMDKSATISSKKNCPMMFCVCVCWNLLEVEEVQVRRKFHILLWRYEARAAVCKRLDLSSATASPGRQPIAVPIVRALCAFSGGVGE